MTEQIDNEVREKKLYHIDWGDGDTTFVWATSKEEAIKLMPDGNDMVNTIVDITGVIQPLIEQAKQEERERIAGIASFTVKLDGDKVVVDRYDWDNLWGYLRNKGEEG